jgi:NAD(P)-dependent dehydrogenase (short-subunit alcohol dehydrogenase family)
MPEEKKQDIQPGVQDAMEKKPEVIAPTYHSSNKLKDKLAIITGGDSGIGKSVAVYFAMEGADIAIVYLEENEDAKNTTEQVESLGRTCLPIEADLTTTSASSIVERVYKKFGKLNILVNNAAVQFPQEDFTKINPEQLEKTFKTNIFAYFYMSQAVLPHLKSGDVIINTASVTAYRGSKHLIDYSSTKGAIVSFTRSLSLNLIDRGIRVNAVAPGPIWTPLIPSTFKKQHIESFGKDTPMKRPGQPSEIAPSYVFLASSDSSYMSGQVLHPNGGEIING